MIKCPYCQEEMLPCKDSNTGYYYAECIGCGMRSPLMATSDSLEYLMWSMADAMKIHEILSKYISRRMQSAEKLNYFE